MCEEKSGDGSLCVKKKLVKNHLKLVNNHFVRVSPVFTQHKRCTVLNVNSGLRKLVNNHLKLAKDNLKLVNNHLVRVSPAFTQHKRCTVLNVNSGADW